MDLPQVSFDKGEVSPIAVERTDAAFYHSALLTCLNFFVRAEGGASNRPGLQFVGPCISNLPLGSYLIPFIYNNVQAYLTEFAPGTVTIYSGGALVQGGISTPYALSDLVNLRWAQSADTLNVVVTTQTPYQLKRLTVDNFTFTAPTILNGPFQDLNTDGTTTVYATGTQGTVGLVASANIFLPSHVGALFTIEEQFLNAIQPWEADSALSVSGASPVGQYCRSDGKIYRCVAAPSATGTTYTGQFQPVHTSGTQQDGTGKPPAGDNQSVQGVSWQFVSQAAGIGLITQVADGKHATAVVQSDKGVWSNFPPTVVGPPQTVQGPFTFTGTGAQTNFSPLSGISSGDPNQFFVTVGGIFQDPSTYTINQSGTSITFFAAPANGAAVSVAQVTGVLGSPALPGIPLSTFWAFGSISKVQGYPATVVYFNDRLVFGGTQLQPQTAFTSKVSNYLDFGSSTPQLDSDGITFTINARRENPIVDLIPLSDLLIGTASSILRVTHSASVGAITPSDISLLPQNFYGQQPVPSVQTGDTVIYAQWGGRKIRDLVYQFAYDKFVGAELTVRARHIFPVGTTVTRMAFAPEPYGLLYCVRSDGVLCVCTYLPEQQITAWSRWTTAGFFEDVCVLPENGSFTVYVIVRRVVNGQTVRYIEKFASREFETQADAFFVDSGLTYDGRNTSTTTMVLTGGTTWVANDTGLVQASSSSGWAGFVESDAANNNAIWLYDSAGNRARVRITGINSATVAQVLFLDPVPSTLQMVTTQTWTFARTTFSGLTNLAGQTVAVVADGGVQPSQPVGVGGGFTLPNACGIIHAGLPYICQLQSLNLNMQGQPSIRNRKKNVSRLSVVTDESGSFKAGPSFDNLAESKIRQFEVYGVPPQLQTGVIHVALPTTNEDDQYLCLQVDTPTPFTALSWFADTDVGEAG